MIRIIKDRFIYSVIKRVFDLIFSVSFLLITSPLLIIFIIAIKLESKGPAFFKQIRLGKDGKQFNLYKLRSMYADAEKDGPKMAERDDERVTKVGRIIRKRRIDEIPQMINIIKGDMSLIGPRPERPYFTEEFCREIPDFILRLQVPCGITGWAQVNCGYSAFADEKLSYDLYYIKNQSFLLDIRILLKTIPLVLKGDNEN